MLQSIFQADFQAEICAIELPFQWVVYHQCSKHNEGNVPHHFECWKFWFENGDGSAQHVSWLVNG